MPEPVRLVCPHAVRRPVMEQDWRDVTYLHWPCDPDAVARRLPPGLRPDLAEGRAWVGLIAFAMRRVRVGGLPPIPYLSAFNETNVRVYAVDGRGRRSVVFLSLDADRAVPVAAARLGFRLPYVWSRMDRATRGDEQRYRTWRRATGTRSHIHVRVGQPVVPTALDAFLTSRWALHVRWWGDRTLWVPIEHEPWPLRAAALVDLDEDLVRAAGLPAPVGAPLVRFSPGVRVRIGLPTA